MEISQVMSEGVCSMQEPSKDSKSFEKTKISQKVFAFAICAFAFIFTLFADLVSLKKPTTHCTKMYTWLTRTPKEKMEADVSHMENELKKMFFQHQRYGQIMLFLDKKLSNTPLVREKFIQIAIEQDEIHIVARVGRSTLNHREYERKSGKLFAQLSAKYDGKSREQLQQAKEKYQQKAFSQFECKNQLEVKLHDTREVLRSPS